VVNGAADSAAVATGPFDVPALDPELDETIAGSVPQDETRDGGRAGTG
jgi:hypothetical protein